VDLSAHPFLDLPARPADCPAYRDDILYPISFDEAGAEANMRIFFDGAEIAGQGAPPQELERLMQKTLTRHDGGTNARASQ
jgi:hypothetical protein